MQFSAKSRCRSQEKTDCERWPLRWLLTGRRNPAVRLLCRMCSTKIMVRILLCATALGWCQLAAVGQGTPFRGDGAIGRILLTNDGYWPTFERYERPPWSIAIFMRFLTVPQAQTPWVSGRDVC